MTYRFFHNSIFLKKIQCEVTSRSHFFLLTGIDLAYDLTELGKAKIWIDENHKANIRIQELEFCINSWEELKILWEIFIQGVYNIQTKEEFVFIDIGMNVAMTSLFLASKQNVIGVYSYEPFQETFQLGLKNIERNPSYSPKIHAFNHGVGARTEDLVADYFVEFKGSVGVRGIPARVLNDARLKNVRKERIVLRGVDEVLSDIRARHKQKKLVIKIDCEGSEYEIIRLLSEKRLLKELDVIMLEWHTDGPNELIKILAGNQFTCFSFDSLRKDIGMIYAVQKHQETDEVN